MDGEAGADQQKSVEIEQSLQSTKRYIHSDIFDRLHDDDDELVGIIAYGLYQRRKRQWISSFEKDRGRTPSELEVKDYCYAYTESVLADLKHQAGNLLFGVCEGLVEHQTNEMQANAFNAKATEELSNLNAKVDHISGYRHHIVGHVVGFAVLVALVWFVSVVIKYEPTIAHFVGAE